MKKPNISWIETHHEIVTAIAIAENSPTHCKADKVREEGGTGAIYEMAETLTDKFENEFSNVEWGVAMEFFEVIESFIENEIY